MIIELGIFAFIWANILSLLRVWAAFSPNWSASDEMTLKFVVRETWLEALLVTFSFLALIWAFVTSDFSLKLAFEHSHSLKPLIYKISGVWGNHEGSMLLWAWVLSIVSAAFALFGKGESSKQKTYILGTQGAISTGFFAFILLTSNPFARLIPAPLEGQDLNPVLQDIGLAFHPPLLYIGYVGFSLAFSFAMAALLLGQVTSNWAQKLKPWALGAWCFLTLGIALGSYWAYYELGWGGFWFWDPVENASLVPWLIGTALIHSLAVLEKREALKIWTILLALLAFIAALLGTFLVRSGVLNSVHAFANDPARGVFILLLMATLSGAGLFLFALRFSKLTQGVAFAPISREAALVFNNLFLTAAAFTVLVGTLYPMFLEALTDRKITVGAPFFNLTTLPLLAPLALVMPFGQRLAWKNGNLYNVFKNVLPALAAVSLFTAILAYIYSIKAPIVLLGVALGVYTLCASLSQMFEHGANRSIWQRIQSTPRKTFATIVAHAGFGISILGIAFSLLSTEALTYMKPSDAVQLGEYKITMNNVGQNTHGTYDELNTTFEVYSGNASLGTLEAARRLYKTRQMPTTEAGLFTLGFSQIYITLGEIQGDKIAVRTQHKPLVLLIWIGALFMALGGALALPQRKQLLRTSAAIMLVYALMPMPANAISPQEQLQDPKLERHAREIFEHYRCVVCQNQSLSDSNAEIAQDMRALIREKLTQGASESDIQQFLVSRYGDFVLLTPPKDEGTLLLWLAPALILLVGGAMARKLFASKQMPE